MVPPFARIVGLLNPPPMPPILIGLCGGVILGGDIGMTGFGIDVLGGMNGTISSLGMRGIKSSLLSGILS